MPAIISTLNPPRTENDNTPLASDNDDNRGNWATGIASWLVTSLKGLYSLGKSAITSAMKSLISTVTGKIAQYIGFAVNDTYIQHLLFAISCSLIFVLCSSLGAPKLVTCASLAIFAAAYGPSMPAKMAAGLLTVLVAYQNPVNSVNVTTNVYNQQSFSDIPFKLILAGFCLFLQGYIPVDKAWDHFLTRCDRVPKAIRGVTQLTEMMESVFNVVSDEVTVLLGGPRRPDMVIPEDVTKNYEKVVEYSRAEVIARIATDPETRQLIENEYQTYYRLRRAYAGNREIRTFLDKYNGVIGSLMARVSNNTPGATNNRQKPVVAFFRGGTGVGKSELLYFLGVDALNHLHQIKTDDSDDEIRNTINACMYPRYIDNEYWDAYSAQPICLYDDFGQLKDSHSNPNLEYMELIRCANRFPYALHMADLGAKANTFFKSKFLFATTNLSVIDPSSVVDPAAVRSRIDFGFDVSVKADFQVNSQGDREEDHKIDRNKIAESFPNGPSLDIYVFKCWDSLTGNVFGEEMNYEEVVRLLLAKETALRLEHERSMNGYVDYARLRFSQQGNSIGGTYTPPSFNYRAALENARSYLADLVDKFQRLNNHPVFGHFAIVSPILLVTSLIGAVLVSYLTRDKKHYDQNTKWILANENCYLSSVYLLNSLGPVRLTTILWNKDDDYVELLNLGALHNMDLVKGCYVALANYNSLCGRNRERKESFLFVATLTVATAMAEYYKQTMIFEYDYYIDDEEVWNRLDYVRSMMIKKQSGRDTLSKVPRMKIESTTVTEESGRDVLTNRANAFKVEAFSSIQAQQVVRHIKTNFWTVTYDGNVATIFAIGGRKFLVNRHYWFGRFNKAKKLTLSQYGSTTGYDFTIDECQVEETKRDPHEADAVVVTFPRRVILSKKMSNHFLRSNNLHSLKRKTVVLVSPVHDETNGWRHASGEITDVMITNMVTNDIDGALITNRATVLSSTVRSQDGDCGGVYVLDDDSYPNKIVGFHYGGLQEGGALAVPLVYEDFEEMMNGEYYTEAPEEVLPIEKTPKVVSVVMQGRVARAPPASVRTQIVKTPIHGEVQETTVAPCKLGRLLTDDGPGLKGLAKVGGIVPMLNVEYLEKASHSLKSKLFVGRECVEKRVLTFEEAVAGVPDEPLMKGVNRSRSAGYPWTLTSTNGKRLWFGSDAWELDSIRALEVKAVVENRIENYKQRIVIPALYTDTLKDETRTLEKVAAGKTRVFAAAPMHLVILVRMYFLSFFAYVMKNRNYNEVSVGTCAQSLDWDVLAKILKQKGNRMIAGDFTNYDGTLHPDILYAVCDMINDWYDDEHADVRRCLFEDIVHSWHVSESEVNSWSHSQPSGNPGTAIFNSLYNSLVMRMAYYDLEQQQHPETNSVLFDTFNKAISMVSYGDDNLLSVSHVAPWFNPETVSAALLKLGMIYTSEDKSAVVSEYRTIDKVSYLKRGFRFEERIAAWVAPLQQDSINERLNWHKKTKLEYEVLQQNMEGAIAEWALHDNETFNFWTSRIAAVALKRNLYVPVFQQEKYLESVRAGKYAKDFPALTFC